MQLANLVGTNADLVLLSEKEVVGADLAGHAHALQLGRTDHLKSRN